MKASKCKDGEKVAIFLTLIGAEAFEAVSNYVSPDEPTDKTYAQLTELLQKHYQPHHSEISLRLQFRSQKQKPNESISEYILELKKLSKRCGYGTELKFFYTTPSWEVCKVTNFKQNNCSRETI